MTRNMDINWDKYPMVASNKEAHAWLIRLANRGKAPNTLDAYGRGLNDFLEFCNRSEVEPAQITEEHVDLYIKDMRTRPSRLGVTVVDIASGAGLKNATMQQRLTVVRLWNDDLVRKKIREDNPVSRGVFNPHNSRGSKRGLLARLSKLPWIPNDDEWRAILRAARVESLRNKVMLLFAFEGALRREELCSLHTGDIDVANRLINIRAETSKGKTARVVVYTDITSRIYVEYLAHRRRMFPSAPRGGPLFLSESNRNAGEQVAVWSWNKIVKSIAQRTAIDRVTNNLSTHTFRHLYLTELARAGWEILEIAKYAGHKHTDTTMKYIHLSGRDLGPKVAKTMKRVQEKLNELTGE
jgi:integrase/recombinase XerD